MAGNPLVYDVACVAAVNAFCATLNGGTLQIYSGGQPVLDAGLSGTLLATLTLNATFAPTAVASAGTVTATANAITNGIAGNTGTAGYFALVTSGSVTSATGVCATSGGDLNLSTLSINAGQTVSCSSFLVTMAQT